MDTNFFTKNDEEVTKLMCRILLWMTLIFPVFFLLSVTRVFSITVVALAQLLPLGLICTISPTILLKKGVKTTFLKNYSIIAVGLFIAIMASNSHVGIYMTYCLALAFSCLYFDKQLTKRTAVIGYIFLVVAVFFRSGNVELDADETRIKWFIAYTLGYTMEYVAMSLVFISLAGRARKLLENLYNTEQIKKILEHCGIASDSLSLLMGKLKKSIDDTVENNGRIKEVTDKTKDGCEYNLDQVTQTTASIQELDTNIHEITQQTQKLTEITNSSYEKTRNYIEVMNQAVEAMEQIRQSSNTIQEQILEVENCRHEISDFANTISSIAAKTNILALNASIEAARAGEGGRGFSVVASQVGQLASATSKATVSIKQRIEQMNTSVNGARESVEENARTVEAGLTGITTARDEAGTLLELQNASNESVGEVEKNLRVNEGGQNKVSAMAVDMSSVTQESLHQVEIIQEALEAQSELANHMQEVFDEVEAISEKLLRLSKETV